HEAFGAPGPIEMPEADASDVRGIGIIGHAFQLARPDMRAGEVEIDRGLDDPFLDVRLLKYVVELLFPGRGLEERIPERGHVPRRRNQPAKLEPAPPALVLASFIPAVLGL